MMMAQLLLLCLMCVMKLKTQTLFSLPSFLRCSFCFLRVIEASEMSDENLRIVLVGERAAGKTALTRALLEEPFTPDYTPTVLDDYRLFSFSSFFHVLFLFLFFKRTFPQLHLPFFFFPSSFPNLPQ